MAVRGIHMDLKGLTPTVEYMKRAIPRLAEYKVNTLMMEYENAVRLDSTAGVEKPSAWSKADVEALAQLARKHHITLMPLVQALGHVEYILRHDAYARYRETQDGVQQYCPTNPATFEFWRSQADEIIELFPDSPYFHVGGDETRQLGECRRCKARLAKGEERVDLYLSQMDKVWRHLLDRGYTPIFWHDMIYREGSERSFRRVPKGVAAMPWDYQTGGGPSSRIVHIGEEGMGMAGVRAWFAHEWLQGHRVSDRRHSLFVDELPAGLWKRYQRYAEKPDMAPYLHPFPPIEMFAERGFEVLAGAGARCGAASTGLADLPVGVDNIRGWAMHIVKAGQTGAVSTAWSRSGSLTRPYTPPMDTIWYTMLASAQFYWDAGQDVERFQTLFTRDFFGLDDGGWAAQVFETVSSLASNAAMRELQNLSVKRNRDALEAFQLVGRFHGALMDMMANLPSHLLTLYIKDKPYRDQPFRLDKDPNLGRIAGPIQRMQDLKAPLDEYYHRVLLPEEADEALASLFDWVQKVDLGL
jgi:hexosaminidase